MDSIGQPAKTYISSEQTLNAVLMTYQKRLLIGTDGERTVLLARLDVDNDICTLVSQGTVQIKRFWFLEILTMGKNFQMFLLRTETRQF